MENLTTDAAKIVHDAKNAMQEAKVAMEIANTGPTNAELQEGFDDLRKDFANHAEKDKEFQDGANAFQSSQTEVNDKVVASLEALHKRFDDLGTKDDIMNLTTFVKNATIGAGIVKFSFNNASKLGSFLLFVLAVGAFFKFGFAAFIAALLGR